MNAIALPRITLPAFDLTLFEKQLTKAGDRLDYTHGYQVLRDQKLLRTLDRLGIMPFEVQAVQDYKKMMQRTTNRWKMPWNWMEWYTTDLRRYAAPIPMEVIEKVNLIRDEQCVGVGIDYFAKERYEYNADPFLWVQAADTTPRHYVAVWDEPKFF